MDHVVSNDVSANVPAIETITAIVDTLKVPAVDCTILTKWPEVKIPKNVIPSVDETIKLQVSQAEVTDEVVAGVPFADATEQEPPRPLIVFGPHLEGVLNIPPTEGTTTGPPADAMVDNTENVEQSDISLPPNEASASGPAFEVPPNTPVAASTTSGQSLQALENAPIIESVGNDPTAEASACKSSTETTAESCFTIPAIIITAPSGKELSVEVRDRL